MYSITLNLKSKPVLVIGAGGVGERKIMSLLDAGADLTVISEKCSNQLKSLAKNKNISLKEKGYEYGDCHGYFLVIGSTDSPETNTEIEKECSREGILLNIVDRPEFCSFHVPAVVKRGDFQIAVSTGGKSPALSGEICRELEKRYGEEYGRLTERLGSIRMELKQKYRNDREELSRQLHCVFREEYAKFLKSNLNS